MCLEYAFSSFSIFNQQQFAKYMHGWWNLVEVGQLPYQIFNIYYYLPQYAIPIFERFTMACHTNISGPPPPLICTLRLMFHMKIYKH